MRARVAPPLAPTWPSSSSHHLPSPRRCQPPSPPPAAATPQPPAASPFTSAGPHPVDDMDLPCASYLACHPHPLGALPQLLLMVKSNALVPLHGPGAMALPHDRLLPTGALHPPSTIFSVPHSRRGSGSPFPSPLSRLPATSTVDALPPTTPTHPPRSFLPLNNNGDLMAWPSSRRRYPLSRAVMAAMDWSSHAPAISSASGATAGTLARSQHLPTWTMPTRTITHREPSSIPTSLCFAPTSLHLWLHCVFRCQPRLLVLEAVACRLSLQH